MLPKKKPDSATLVSRAQKASTNLYVNLQTMDGLISGLRFWVKNNRKQLTRIDKALDTLDRRFNPDRNR